MAKLCKDFLFSDKRISDFKVNDNPKYIFVNFEENPDIILSLKRSMESGETNRFRTEANHFYASWDENLPLEFHIVKNPCLYNSQNELEITREEIREITRWLTSSHFPEWLKIDNFDNDNENDAIFYKGWFENIETFSVAGVVYGLKLYFKCTTPFAYTDFITHETSVSNYKYLLVNNNSDELNNYCYPIMEIKPKSNGQIFICNQSDYELLDNGTLEGSESYFSSLLAKVESYAKLNGYKVKHLGQGAHNVVPICNNTAIQFKLVDVYDNEFLCTAFYLTDTKEYRIISGGFMYMNVYKDLNIYINTQNLQITDSLGRMITYDKLGIQDVGSIYWTRLMSGNNSFLLYGNFDLTLKYRETRKVGEI